MAPIRQAFAFDQHPSPDGRPFGIDVAIEGLFRAWFRHGRQEVFQAVVPLAEHYPTFLRLAASEGIPPGRCRGFAWGDTANPGVLDCVFVPDPSIARHAWIRRRGSQDNYALCGVAHGLAGEAVARMVGDCVAAPTEPWDAIICPSKAVRASIAALWEGWTDYYAQRFGVPVSCPVQLPVIPLGIDCDRLARITTAEHRADQRRRLGVDDDTVVILSFGRLSYVTKAHPMPLLQAVSRVAAQTGRKLLLVLEGYFFPDTVGGEFRRMAEEYCPDVRVKFVVEPSADYPDGLWAAGDVFVSLADNIQESFGLTPVEAMAAGLPAVCSDWDGYRDTVRHGIDGFLVPTLMPEAGTGHFVAHRYFLGQDLYGQYLAGTAQSTAVSVDGVAEALAELVVNPELRRRMGESGRERARSTYHWPVVMAEYEVLWAELAGQRHSRPALSPRQGLLDVHPGFPDPFRMFAGFPTLAVGDRTRLRSDAELDVLRNMFRHRMNMPNPELLLSPSQCIALLIGIARNPGISVAELTASGFTERPKLLRTVCWLIKLGLCRAM